MRKFKYLYIVALAALGFGASSCDDYLEVNLQDQMTLAEVFSKRVTTERYLTHIYSYLPYEYDYIGTNKNIYNGKYGDGYVVSRSDEATFSFYQWVPYLPIKYGNNSPALGDFNNWTHLYMGINQATVFMANVDACPEISAENKAVMKAEARFLRAYCYFQLFRKFGPVYLWAQKNADGTWTALTPDSGIDPLAIDRNTVDENVDFMTYEMDECIKVLPLTISDMENWGGRLTKGAARAAKARMLLYAARPLFNGCDLYKGKMKNIWGNYLFPQEYDRSKWQRAKQAAKDVIDMNMYSLCKNETDKGSTLKNAIASYQKIYFTPWNEECIWGQWARNMDAYQEGIAAFSVKVRCQPANVTKQGYSGYCPSLELVDTYPMEKSGRYPITGYDDNHLPIVDPESGYEATGFTDGWKHPIEGDFGGIKVHNSCKGRDARYYACVLANGFWWIFNYNGKKLTTFYTGGTNSFATNQNVKVGFLWRRFNEPELNTDNGSWGNLFWNYYRLGEVYLNYAEACLELGELSEACEYINKVRERAGLNKIEEAYPGIDGNQALLREMYRKERMVELAFECHRFYDACQWMIGTEVMNGPIMCLNLKATNYEASWERSAEVWSGGQKVFRERDYLFPIGQTQLNESRNLTQNYGW